MKQNFFFVCWSELTGGAADPSAPLPHHKRNSLYVSNLAKILEKSK
jgi:hypothetical protein